MLDANHVRKTVETYVEGWRSGDRALWASVFADDAVFVDPVGSEPNVGKAACVAFYDNVQKMPFRFTPNVHRIAVCGDEALLLFRMEAVNPEGHGYFVEVADIFAFDAAGKVKSLKAYWDKGCQGKIRP